MTGSIGRRIIWTAAALLMAAPAVAAQLTAEMQWTGFDFLAWGLMLLSAVGGYELLARLNGTTAYRAGAGLAVVGVFLLMWINLAVGVIGSEGNRANLLFAMVIATMVGGAIAVHGRARGMARVMLAAAGVQAGSALFALGIGAGAEGARWPWDVIGATGVFTALWILSAWLFAAAARGPALRAAVAGQRSER